MKFTILAALPEVLAGWASAGVLGRAAAAGRLEISVRGIREWATDRHRTIDDRPFGGGTGMVLKPDVVVRAVEALRTPETDVILLSPAGEVFRQETARAFASAGRDLLLIAPRYEGVDERVVEVLRPRLLSVGDFVLSGGETAAALVVEACARLLPGVLGGGAEAIAEESFGDGGLEYPHYTRPETFRGRPVPEVLRSGDHARIRAWREDAGRERTARLRPDLNLIVRNGETR